MKPSKYNYFLPYKNKTVCYSGLTDSFFIIPSERTDSYRTIIENPDQHKKIFGSFIDKMRLQGFILDNEVDEMALVRKKLEPLTTPHQYFLMILPTYQCNLRCWYCIQKHENLFMSKETVDAIKERIKLKLDNPEITEFQLSWFGGEPLLAYDIVLELTRFGRDYAESKGKKFAASITTNGTLLTAERIENLRDAGVKYYQITIDGDPVTHDLIKQLGKISAYDRTLSNIEQIARHTMVGLRFNYTRDNLKPAEVLAGIKSRLSEESRKNIRFNIYKVWQQQEEEINEADVEELFKMGKEAGMYPTFATTGVCYTDRKYFDCIFPNGRVGKCDNHNPEDMPGLLLKNGEVIWEEDVTDIYKLHLGQKEQGECNACQYLPVCWGPCQVKRERMLKEAGKITCMYADKHKDMRNHILNHCKTELQEI